MKTWGKVIQALCEEANRENLNLYIVEGDKELNWFGAKLEDFCTEEVYSAEDVEVFKKVKEKISDKLEGKGYIVLISPMNLWADIYEASVPKFKNPNPSDRPFGVSFDRFRVGFFEDKKKAVDFMLNVAKTLRDKFNLHLHLFYA